MSRWGASCIRTLLWPADHMNSHLHLTLLGMYEVQPSAVKNAAVTLLGTGRRERERESREGLCFCHQFLKGFLTCLRYLAVCAWRSPVRLPTLKSSNLHWLLHAQQLLVSSIFMSETSYHRIFAWYIDDHISFLSRLATPR